MRNWSTDTTELKKDKKQYAIWRLEQMVNFGLGRQKINRQELKKYWKIIRIDHNKKQFLKMILWPKRS